ncbi:EF-hand domain-containing protein [Sphingomonas sp. RP10(2022)]|uniref:EF-hand domain-containing protein n=1 Tax=Sphingomonas liriopis TaxID=2949094 RepID=A0A9X2KPS9_9SPHN|nr:EF-hand domain-containing protein [Sphingomonas liriopis]MCP3734232.1 EF-hand domain-containing protein [Sphingomonas liriopis]
MMTILLALLLTAPSATPVGETRAQNEAAALALHRRMDADHDGYVSFAEMRAAAQAMVVPKNRSVGQLPDERIARAEFDRADTDHDGRISTAESIAGADRAFTEADTNHDGVLSPDERGAHAARALATLQAAMTHWQPLPCHAGAACDPAVAPADRLAQLDRFRDTLSPADRTRLDAALPRAPDGGIAQCDRTTGSRASCEAAAYLPALTATHLMPRFLATIRQAAPRPQ